MAKGTILVKPIISEKFTRQGDQFNRYGFVVNNKANKIEIKKAVEEMYSVSVTRVNTAVMPGKLKTRQTKSGIITGSTGAFKKAYVTLADGDAIDFYANI